MVYFSNKQQNAILIGTMSTRASQEFIPIKEVRDGIVILKDGGMRSIIMTSSTNFALKSENEQQSIIFQFQNFLNSLNFDVQICIQSRRLDIRDYIDSLQKRQREQVSELMQIQIREYIDFIRTFTRSTNIMTKNFFIVIPYDPPQIEIKKGGLPVFSRNKKNTTMPDTSFEEARIQLEQRVAVVQQGIIRSGIRAAQLGTEEIVEVYYKLFNPDDVDQPVPVRG